MEKVESAPTKFKMMILEVKLDVIRRFENGDSRLKMGQDLDCMKPLK